MYQPRLYLSGELATELQRDRRTMSEALRNIDPDGKIGNKDAWYVLTAFRALNRDKVGARERKVAAEADLAELQLAQKRSELANIQRIAEAVDAERSVVRERLLGMVGKLSGRLSPDDVQLVENELYEALEQLGSGESLTGDVASLGDPEEGPDDLEAAPAPEPDRVGGHLPSRGAKDQRRPRKVEKLRAASGIRSDERSDRA